jgi:ribosome-associated protein
MVISGEAPPEMAAPTPIAVDLPITLGQFVKVAGLADTGGDAKRLVAAGLVQVNAQVEKRRGHKLVPGDIVATQGAAAEVVLRSGGPRSVASRFGGPKLPRASGD